MYKIYINDTPLLLTGQQEFSRLTVSDTRLVTRYPGKSKFLLHYVNMLENTNRWEYICLYSPDPAALWNDFRLLFQVRELLGAVICKGDAQLFLKQEDGHYQFPVTPLPPATDPQRMIQELAATWFGPGIQIADTPLRITYHTQRAGRDRILNRTQWFRLQLNDFENRPSEASGKWMATDALLKKTTLIPAHMASIIAAADSL